MYKYNVPIEIEVAQLNNYDVLVVNVKIIHAGLAINRFKIFPQFSDLKKNSPL